MREDIWLNFDSKVTFDDGSKVADLTFIAGAVLCINCDFPEYNWEALKNNETFMLLFRNLKIFKIVKNTQEELLLEYIG